MRQKSRATIYAQRPVIAVYVDTRTGRCIEILDCGHAQPERQDIYGPVPAVRRR